jgi:hypothetical protein
MMRGIIKLNVRSFAFLAAIFIALTTGTQSNSQPADKWHPLFAWNAFGVGIGDFDQRNLLRKPSSKIDQDNAVRYWRSFRQDHPSNDLQWQSFGMDYDKSMQAKGGVRAFQGLPPVSGSTYPTDQLRLGNNYIGIKTQKTYYGAVPSGPSDCSTDDDCADYSGLPKPKQPKMTKGNFRKPFVGLSITTPIN